MQPFHRGIAQVSVPQIHGNAGREQEHQRSKRKIEPTTNSHEPGSRTEILKRGAAGILLPLRQDSGMKSKNSEIYRVSSVKYVGIADFCPKFTDFASRQR